MNKQLYWNWIGSLTTSPKRSSPKNFGSSALAGGSDRLKKAKRQRFVQLVVLASRLFGPNESKDGLVVDPMTSTFTLQLALARTFPHRAELELLTNIYHLMSPEDSACCLTVHPVPAPTSTKAELSNSRRLGGNNQKLTLFIRGNAISGAPISRGTNQLPKPPINAGITIKKIIKKACAVMITLYS